MIPSPCCTLPPPPGLPSPYIPCEVADALLAAHGDPVVFEWPDTETCYMLTATSQRVQFLQGVEFEPVGPFFGCCDSSGGCCCDGHYLVFEPCDCQPASGTRVLVGPYVSAPAIPEGCYGWSACPCDAPGGSGGRCGVFTGVVNSVQPGDCVIDAALDFCFGLLAPGGPMGCGPDPCCDRLACCGLTDPCQTNLCPCCVAVTTVWTWGIQPFDCLAGGTCLPCPDVSVVVLCRDPPSESYSYRPGGCGALGGCECNAGVCGACDGFPGPCQWQICGGSCQAPGCPSSSCCFNMLSCSGPDVGIQRWSLGVGIRLPCCSVQSPGCICRGGAACTSCVGVGCQNGATWVNDRPCEEWTLCPPAAGWVQACGCYGTTAVVTVG